MARFDHMGRIGAHAFDPAWIANLSDMELASEIRSLQEWDYDLLYDLCWRADMEDEYEEDDDILRIPLIAAEKLGVRILDEGK